MREMKKMTREEFLNSKIGDYFDLDINFLLKTKEIKSPIFDRNNDCINTDYFEVSIIEVKPPVTQENLCKFQLKFNGDLPTAFFYETTAIAKLVTNGELAFISEPLFICRACFKAFGKCEITDSRWTEENLRCEN